jgi:O-methyltransferase involved in polyketide biosynthesis
VGAERISPTAHYTGQCWLRNGLSHRALGTPQGRVLYDGLRPLNAIAARIGAPTLEGMLLARHRHIDRVLDEAIALGRVRQVVEIAAGLSPRGWDFARRHGDALTYIEADLPDMARHKEQLLSRARLLGPRHRVVALDALADSGPMSLAHLANTLDPTQGLAIVTEGLINYFPTDAVRGLWHRIAEALKQFAHGLYLSDLHVAGENRGMGVQVFGALLSTFVRGRVHLHFGSVDEATQALHGAGFAIAELDAPEAQRTARGHLDRAGPRLVRVLRAQTRSVLDTTSQASFGHGTGVPR